MTLDEQKEMFQSILKQLNENKEEMKLIKDETHFIKKALLGDEYNEYGLIKRVRELEAEVLELKKFKDRIIYMSVGIGSLVGLIFTAINHLIGFFKK